MRNLTVEDVNSTAIMVSFLAPSSPNGIITAYKILYVEIEGGGPVGSEVTILVSPNEMGSFTMVIIDLFAFTMYRVRVVAETSVGPGETVMVIANTDPAASSPPTIFTVTAVSSTSITVSWEYPETPRGIIQGYIIRYYLSSDIDISTEVNVTLSIAGDNNTQTFTITGLLPFTSYCITIRAYSFGENPFIVHQGDESATLTNITAEAGLNY